MARPNDPLLALQWYIDGSGYPVPRADLNVKPVWADYSGAGITIGIYDSLVERAHPDLAANYDDSFRLEGLVYDSTASAHGTHVAGVIAGVANDIGVTGIAFGAHVTSLPVIFSSSIAMAWLMQAMPEAWRFDVVNMSYGGNTAFDAYLGPDGWAELQPGYTKAAEEGRDGLGTVLVAAAGNLRGGFTDANLSYFQTERHLVVMGAVGTEGFVAEYSSEGANLLASAPSSDGFMEPGVTTTDRSGIEGRNDGTNPPYDPVDWDYTTRFGGTSAAAPMAAAISALMLEANPGLGWRDVRTILALSARHTGSAIGAAPENYEHTAWTENGATTVNGGGMHFSNDYGFGLIDALAAVRLAESWQGQRTSANEASRSAAYAGDPLPIPSTGIPFAFTLHLDPGVMAETVTLHIDIAHDTARELDIRLVSPRGTESILFHRQGEPAGIGGQPARFRPWTFVSNAFMGENTAGDWQVVITDTFGGRAGTVLGATLTAYGSPRTADTTWFYTNEFGALAGMADRDTIRDTAGTDTINAAAVTAGSDIRLRPGAHSTINGHTVRNAVGTTIEHAIGGDGADIIRGNAADNRLQGGRGDDTLLGGQGRDTLEGGVGNDSLAGGPGADLLLGGAGDDFYRVENFTDQVIDTSGADTIAASVTYTLPAGVEALFLQGSAGLHGWGNAGDNLIVGSTGADSLRGGMGDDTLDGGAGADSLTGGTGEDRFILHAGLADGDQIEDFHGGHDRLVLDGFGADAMLVRLDATDWLASGSGGSAVIRFASGVAIDVGDYAFV